MKKIIHIILIGMALVTAQLANAQSTLYLSNLVEPSVGNASIGSDSWLAESFSTGTNSRGYILNFIQLLMGTASGSPTGFTASLYGNGSFPGHSLGSLSGSTDPSAAGLFAYTTSGITLSPSTVYFIVLTAGTPVAQGSYMQKYAASYNYGSDDNWILTQYRYTSADGINWDRGGYPGNGLQFAVNATGVPEPATYVLIGLGFVCLIFCRARKPSTLSKQ